MKDIARMALQTDMELAKDVTGPSGEVIVKAHTKVTPEIIQKLARYNIMLVTIMEAVDYAETYFEKIRLSDGFKKFDRTYQEVMPRYKQVMDAFINEGTEIPMDELMEIYESLKSLAGSRYGVIDYLYNMLPSEDDLTYAHCLNSALIAGVFGTWLCMKEEEIRTLIQCGFLYDIGKFKLPHDLIWKPSMLTPVEYAQIKTHTILGFQLLQNHNLDDNILKATLSHHERFDGSGYPSKLHDYQINLYARIIAIIDSYEAMTSARTYRQSKHPFQIIDIFQTDAFKYDMDILRQILFNLGNHLVGQKVLLSNDVIAEVVLINQSNMSRPLLRMENGGPFIDLLVERDLKIVSIY